MGLLDRAIKNGISNAIGNAVEKGVRKAVEPRVEQAAANAMNNAADRVTEAAGMPKYDPQQAVDQERLSQSASTLGGAFGSFSSAMQSYATEAAKNMKVCPACGEAATADVKFCPSCGARLPETTVAEGAVCPACGKQNVVGTKFCAGCGTKLPAAVAEEEAARARDAAVLAEWDSLLPCYPKWNCGGCDYRLEHGGYDDKGRPYYYFTVHRTDYAALTRYKDTLRANGFQKPPRYSSDEELFKVVGGVSYSMNSSEPFPSDPDVLSVIFHVREFEEAPPEKKTLGLKDIFKF